jgi:hypothetical protein
MTNTRVVASVVKLYQTPRIRSAYHHCKDNSRSLSFNFVGHFVDNIKLGLHPLNIMDGNLEHWQTNMEIAHHYSLLQSVSTLCSLADLEALNAGTVLGNV